MCFRCWLHTHYTYTQHHSLPVPSFMSLLSLLFFVLQKCCRPFTVAFMRYNLKIRIAPLSYLLNAQKYFEPTNIDKTTKYFRIAEVFWMCVCVCDCGDAKTETTLNDRTAEKKRKCKKNVTIWSLVDVKEKEGNEAVN